MEYHAVRKSRKPLNSIENELCNSQFRIIFAISEIFHPKFPLLTRLLNFDILKRFRIDNQIHFNLIGLEKFKNEIEPKCLFGCKCPGNFISFDMSMIRVKIDGSNDLKWSVIFQTRRSRKKSDLIKGVYFPPYKPFILDLTNINAEFMIWKL